MEGGDRSVKSNMNSEENLKMFPWLRYINPVIHKACFSENTDSHEEAFQCIYREVSSETIKIIAEENYSRAKKLCEVLNSYVTAFHMRKITFNEELEVPHRSFIVLMSCLVDLYILLCDGDPSSFHLENCIRDIFMFLGIDSIFIWDVLLRCKLLKKEYSAVLFPIIRHVMKSIPETVSDPSDYMKMLLLMRHWKLFCDSKEDKQAILALARKVTPPANLHHWFRNLNIEGLHQLPSAAKMFVKDILCKKFPKGFFKELQTVLCEDTVDHGLPVHSPSETDFNSCNWNQNPGHDSLFFLDNGQPSQGENSSEHRDNLINFSGFDASIEEEMKVPEMPEMESARKKSKKFHKRTAESDGFPTDPSATVPLSGVEVQTDKMTDSPDSCVENIKHKVLPSTSKSKTRQSDVYATPEKAEGKGYNLRSRKSLLSSPKFKI